MKIWRCDLTKQTEPLLDVLLDATRKIMLSGRYVLGEHLEKFEKEFAAYCDSPYCVGVASGTEALYLALMACDVKHGDEVITTPFTAIPTFSAIVMTGAKPVFADIDATTFNLDPGQVEAKITRRTKVIMPVHLFGQMADMNAFVEIARRRNLVIIEDAAQAHGSRYQGKLGGAFGEMACYSFYPTKNLGAFGDAGAVVTSSKTHYEKLRLLRNYGQESLYRTVINGVNSRLDELQAAYLSIKLPHLESWNARRRELAKMYAEHLPKAHVILPRELPERIQNYHVYVVRVEQRDALQSFLEREGIQSNVYYPVPLHLQKSNSFLGYREDDFPQAEKACREVLALPMYPEMDLNIIVTVSDVIKTFYKEN